MAKDEIEDFKRPSHPDFMTTKELKDSKFSGYRMNSITSACEIWVLGELRKNITTNDLERNPNAVSKAMEELFGLDEAMPATPQVIAYHETKKGDPKH